MNVLFLQGDGVPFVRMVVAGERRKQGWGDVQGWEQQRPACMYSPSKLRTQTACPFLH